MPRLLALILACLLAPQLSAQEQWEDQPIPKAPPRAEGEGPWPHLILRGVTLIDGTGSPPVGPVDIVIERNRIVRIKFVGFPGAPIDPDGRPKAEPGDREMDLSGMYVMPGLIDMHAHIGGKGRPRSTSTSSGWATASPRSASPAARPASTGWWRPSRRASGTRSRRRASSRTSTSARA
jgi:hypothetical protein